MSARSPSILEGMPAAAGPAICAGPPGGVRSWWARRCWSEYGDGDMAMRNMAIVTLRRVGFPGWRVAEVLGLTPTYVATLKSAASRRGAAALAGQDGPGRPRSLGEDQQDLARQWREQGESDLEIGRRLGVAADHGGPPPGRRQRARRRRQAPGRARRSLRSRRRGRALAAEQQPGPGPKAGPEQEDPAGRRRWCGAARSRGGRRSGVTAAGTGRAADHRRGVLVAVCGGDAAARVHGPGRGGAGAGVRRRGRAAAAGPVRRCGAAVGDQHVLRAGG